MRRILFFIILVASGYALNHVGTHFKEKFPAVHKSIHKHTNRSCANYPNFEKKMQNATQESEQCFKNFNPELQSTCDFLLHQFKPCLSNITSLLKSCLPEKSRGTPDFIVDSMLSLFKFVCNSKGSELLELTQPCITPGLGENNPCDIEIENELEKIRNEFPSKEELCKFEKSYEKCIERRLNETCKSEITRNNFFKFYTAMTEPCNKKAN